MFGIDNARERSYFILNVNFVNRLGSFTDELPVLIPSLTADFFSIFFILNLDN